jgi:translation initiation factor 2 subunit 1
MEKDASIESIPIEPVSRVNLQCRMYENKLPEAETCVMVNVRQITDVGAYVHLLEYNNIEGMILLSEVTKKRIRSIGKLVRIGKTEAAIVLRVDKDKGYIDLSRKRISQEDIAACEDRYQKSKQVHSIMRYVAEKQQIDLEILYEMYGWPLYNQYGHAFEAFKVVLTDPDQVFDQFEMNENVKQELIQQIRKRLTPQPIKIRSDVDCSCFGYEGIDAVKNALLQGQAKSTEHVPLKVSFINLD